MPLLIAAHPKKLSAPQRRWLKARAHSLKPAVLVGEDGVHPRVLGAVTDALESHELIKVRLRRPEDKRGEGESVASGCGAHLVAIVGHTLVLYRERKEEPSITLPK